MTKIHFRIGNEAVPSITLSDIKTSHAEELSRLLAYYCPSDNEEATLTPDVVKSLTNWYAHVLRAKPAYDEYFGGNPGYEDFCHTLILRQGDILELLQEELQSAAAR